MKSTVLVGTLAASLVSTLHAEVFVLGASWRERSLVTEDGFIERKMRNNAAPRGYFIMEGNLPTLTGAFIEYRNDRNDGKTYTVTTGFTNFSGDIVSDQTGASTRVFGQAGVPVTFADVPNATMSFSGRVKDNKPQRVVFDHEVFQSGNSTALAGPNLVPSSDMARSILSGTGTDVKVAAVTLDQAITELTNRLEQDGYERAAVAPIIVTDLNPTLVRAGFDATQQLKVTLNADVFPTPTFQWLKGAEPGPYTTVSTAAAYTLPGGAEGDGVYHLVVSTSAGSDTSAFITVSSTNQTVEFVTPVSPTPIVVPVGFSATTVLSAPIKPTALPQVSAATGYQWERAGLAAGPYTAVADNLGGKSPTLTVSGNNTVPDGTVNKPGFYRLKVTQPTTPTPTTITSSVYNVTTVGP